MGENKKGLGSNMEEEFANSADSIEQIEQDIIENATAQEELSIDVKISKEEAEEIREYSSNKQIVNYLVSQYYQSQETRIRVENQARAIVQGVFKSDSAYPSFILKEINNAKLQEGLNKKYMDIITNHIPICRWLKSITGIGPVLSAYIYSVFDLGEGRYATDFQSYAGLNDNRNPWLGKEKATAIVSELNKERTGRLQPVKEILENLLAENGTNMDNFAKALHKVVKNSNVSDVPPISIIVSALESLKKNVSGDSVQEKFADYDVELTELLGIINDKAFVGDYMFSMVAAKTGRKVFLIKKGTYTTKNIKKANKKEYCTISDLTSYLAKPPYNTDCKKHMYIISDMFVKNSSRPKSLYGRIYKERKLYETEKNERGEYAEEAARCLAAKSYAENTIAYKYYSEGKLPPAHIVMRARRYAVKLFISHVYEAMYYDKYHCDPPMHYTIAHLGHHDYIPPEVDFRPFLDGNA